MSAVNQILVLLGAFSGIGLGYALARIAPEELDAGKKWFILLKNALYFAAFVPAIFFNLDYYFSLALILVVLSLGFFVALSYIKSGLKEIVVYMLFSLVFYFSLRNEVTFVLSSSFIFLYGLPAGSLLKTR